MMSTALQFQLLSLNHPTSSKGSISPQNFHLSKVTKIKVELITSKQLYQERDKAITCSQPMMLAHTQTNLFEDQSDMAQPFII